MGLWISSERFSYLSQRTNSNSRKRNTHCRCSNNLKTYIRFKVPLYVNLICIKQKSTNWQEKRENPKNASWKWHFCDIFKAMNCLSLIDDSKYSSWRFFCHYNNEGRLKLNWEVFCDILMDYEVSIGRKSLTFIESSRVEMRVIKEAVRMWC